MSEKSEQCPLCGATPHHGLGKVEHCQLHGEPFQRFSIWCPKGHVKVTSMTEEAAQKEWNARPELTTIRAENELMREALGRIDAFDTIPPMDFLTTAERLECSVGEIKDIARNALAQVAK
jgi:hypothetical protein